MIFFELASSHIIGKRIRKQMTYHDMHKKRKELPCEQIFRDEQEKKKRSTLNNIDQCTYTTV
jgi:hypothetical protein